MKRILAALSLFTVGACATPAMSQVATATVTNVEPKWAERTISVPNNVCSVIRVPVYQSSEATAGDIIGGGILGGVLGGLLTESRQGAIFGSITGGLVANEMVENQRIVGYKNEEVCEVVYNQRSESYIQHYIIDFSLEDFHGVGITSEKYEVGDEIEVNVSVTICRSQNCN